MRILALIPARGGSKRLPRKNVLPLGGKPLIAWSIDAARDIPEVCEILVSTDDPEIASTAREAGASVPWLRPADLATDTAGSVDVALHALDWYETHQGAVDGLLLLQPTSPFRTRATMRAGIDLFRRHPEQPVVGVAPASVHPMWTFQMVDDRLRPFIPGAGLQTRSQDLPPAWMVTGAFYLIAPTMLRAGRSFFGDAPLPLTMTTVHEALDIDTREDFAIAEAIAATLRHGEWQE